MKAEGRVQVVVRSHRVPIGTTFHHVPIYSASGVFLGSQPSRVVLYGTSLDEDHRRSIEEAQKLASSLGVGLEVVDESRSGFLTRLVSRLGGNGAKYPAILVSPSPAMVASAPTPALAHGC